MSNRSTPTQYADDVSTATPRTGGEAVVAALERTGVEHLFGVQGGAIMPVYDALYDSTMGHVTMAHERSAAHAAHAYGVVSGTPGVCLATSGPGATNLVTGLADAAANDAPLLALTGQAPSHLIGRDAFQEAPTVDVTGPVTKANYLVTEVDVVGDIVTEAFALAREGRPGPALVDLPKDVTLATTDRSPTAPSPLAGAGAPEHADPISVSAAAEALAGADRPVVLSGRGVITADASVELRAFVTAHGIPVATTAPGLGSFPEDHPLALSVAGTHGTACANRALANCDAVLAVGAGVDGTTGVEMVAPDAEVVHVDVDATEMPRTDHPLVGDVGTVLEQLFDAMPRSPDAAAWRARADAWRREYAPGDTSADGSLTPRAVVERLDELTPDDTLVTTGGGRHQWWAMQYWTFRQPRTLLSSNLGTMGYGLPAAIGACVATDGDRSVVCIEGPDSFLTTQQELAVAVREALDLTVVVLNDAAPGPSHRPRDAASENRRAAPQRAGGSQFDVLADVFGARGFRLDDPDGVEPTLDAALAVDGPAVVDAHVDTATAVSPTAPPGGDTPAFETDADDR